MCLLEAKNYAFGNTSLANKEDEKSVVLAFIMLEVSYFWASDFWIILFWWLRTCCCLGTVFQIDEEWEIFLRHGVVQNTFGIYYSVS